MNIMRMTEPGKLRFMAFIDSLKTETPQAFPEGLLSAPEFAEPIGGSSETLDALNLDDRLATAKALSEIIDVLGLKSAEKDWGFWTWCSAYLFERLCHKKGGKYNPSEMAAWVAEPNNWQRYYRHYLASIWRVYAAHSGKEAELIVLLNGPVNTPGELWGQIAASQTLITNPSMLDAVHHLFWDKKNQKRKHGSGGGSARDLRRILKQFALTFDFFAMTGDQIVGLLPAAFDRFKELSSA